MSTQPPTTRPLTAPEKVINLLRSMGNTALKERTRNAGKSQKHLGMALGYFNAAEIVARQFSMLRPFVPFVRINNTHFSWVELDDAHTKPYFTQLDHAKEHLITSYTKLNNHIADHPASDCDKVCNRIVQAIMELEELIEKEKETREGSGPSSTTQGTV